MDGALQKNGGELPKQAKTKQLQGQSTSKALSASLSKSPPTTWSFNKDAFKHLMVEGAKDEDETQEGHAQIEVIPGLTREKFLANVAIEVPVLVQRLDLEVKMREMVVKLPTFCVTFGCFVFALMLLSPTQHVVEVNERLIDHFELSDDRLDKVTDFNKLYEFAEAFEHHNEELQATSWKYWCEQRYFKLGWNAELNVPTHECNSPRYNALGHISNPESQWDAVGAVPSPSPGEECVDNDEIIRAQFPQWATCADGATTICTMDIGIQSCKLTCGYCPSFVYERWKPFPTPQITILPGVVSQQRYKSKACDGFATTYEGQKGNQNLGMLPAFDGTREGDLLQCVDRTAEYTEAYAHQVECSPDMPASSCPTGYIALTKKHDFNGDSVYPVMMLEPHLDLLRARTLEWVDVQTAKVQVVALVYTPAPADLYTGVSVIFDVDASGSIKGRHRLSSVRDITGLSATAYCLVLSLAAVLNGMAIYQAFNKVFDASHLMKRTTWWAMVYEMVCRVIMCMYFIVLICLALFGSKMQTEFEGLISTLENVRINCTSAHCRDHAFEPVLTNFFKTMSTLETKTTELTVHRVISYAICYMQFLLLMLYFAAHPRIGVITSTISKAWDHLFHFGIVLCNSFVSLGLISFFAFGSTIKLFSSPTNSFLSQSRLLFGHWIQETEDATMTSEELATVDFVAFWVYIITFMLLMFYMLLNLFLAIIVDAFFEVKKDEEEDETENHFFVDVGDVFSCRAVYRYWRFHSQEHILHVLRKRMSKNQRKLGPGTSTTTFEDIADRQEGVPEEEDHKAVSCPAGDFLTEFPGALDDENHLIVFLSYYYHKCPAILDVREEDGIFHHTGGLTAGERELRSLKTQVNNAKIHVELNKKDFADRLQEERLAVQKVFDHIALEREALAYALAVSAQKRHSQQQKAGRSTKRKVTPRAIPVLDDDWQAVGEAIQIRDLSKSPPSTRRRTDPGARHKKDVGVIRSGSGGRRYSRRRRDRKPRSAPEVAGPVSL